MGATNNLLAKRVDELTEALAEARLDMRQVIETGDIKRLVRRCADIDELVESEGSDEDFDDEESEEEDSDEEDSA